MPNNIENIEEKLWAKTIIDEKTGCRLWIGVQTDGYGQIQFNYKLENVHRISAMLYLGYDLDDKLNQINHKRECRNSNCWNPEHLYIGTQQENVIDAFANGRIHPNTWKTHCPKGHEYNEENTYLNRTHGRVCKICARKRAKERIELLQMIARQRAK